MTKFKGSNLAKKMESDAARESGEIVTGNNFWSPVNNSSNHHHQEQPSILFQSQRATPSPSSSSIPSPNHEGIRREDCDQGPCPVMDLTANGKQHIQLPSGGAVQWHSQPRPVKINLSPSQSSIDVDQSRLDNHQNNHSHYDGHLHGSNHDMLTVDHDRDLSASPSNMSTSSQGSSCHRSGSGGHMSMSRSRKRNPNPIPDSCKDEAYWERRKRNNESAKRSRELRRIKEAQQSSKVTVLEQENLRLRTEVDMLREELNKLREILYTNNNNNNPAMRNSNYS